MKKIITICSSASFYKEVLHIADDLAQRGFAIKIPSTAHKMKRNKDFNIKRYKTWFSDARDYRKKTKLMQDHFQKITKSDAVLIVNQTKHGMKGYIGGNVLMEMALAFHLKKRIYIANDISANAPFKEEILGMQPIFIQGDLSKVI